MLNINEKRMLTKFELEKLSRDLVEGSKEKFKGIPHDKFLETFYKICDKKKIKYSNVNFFVWDGYLNLCITADIKSSLGARYSEYRPRLCITAINNVDKCLNIYGGVERPEFGCIVPFKNSLRRTSNLEKFELELANGLSETEILLDYQLKTIIDKARMKLVPDSVLHYLLLNAGSAGIIGWNQVGKIFTRTQKKASLTMESLLFMQSDEVRVKQNRPRYQLESMYHFYNLAIRS